MPGNGTGCEIDANFKIDIQIKKDGMRFYNSDSKPFCVHGVFKENGKYRRIPENVANSVSDEVLFLHTNTAGGRIRFRTNSKRVAIIAKMDGIGKMPHFALSGSAGFDMYVDDRYAGSFIPPFDIATEYESCLELDSEQMKNITINFPLYSNLNELYIGIDEGATLQSPVPYRHTKPIVYYGSSITQGGCASRPGNSYESILSRLFDCDYVNLGFSGSAKAEDEMVQYISGLDMSVFVYDYDHNAPSIEHLKKTHEKMFKAIRNKNPNLPIIIMSRPKYDLDGQEQERLVIIRTTYENAVSEGDKNVYFISGRQLMSKALDNGTVDKVHPNDFGFYSMADALGNVLKTILDSTVIIGISYLR